MEFKSFCSVVKIACVLSSIMFIFSCREAIASNKQRNEFEYDLDRFIFNTLKRQSLLSAQHGDFAKENIQKLRQSLVIEIQKIASERLNHQGLVKASSKSFPHVGIDPDAKRDVIQLVSSQGYPADKYTVRTADGFLLEVDRIPYGRKGKGKVDGVDDSKPRPVVFLQHGLLSSAADWVINFANDSLGMILADHGYDVWMGNSRGNTYSKRHVDLTPDDDQFWDWSFDEMVKYDIPATIDFILNKTGQPSLYYVGHSQGTIIAFAALTSRAEYQRKIRLFVGMAPIISLNNVTSPIKYLSHVTNEQGFLFFGRKGFLQNDVITKFIADYLCDNELSNWICYNFDSLIGGYDLPNLNKSRLTVYFNHSPAGTSVKNMIHYAQFLRTKRFAMYDFGSPEENIKHYNQSLPPAYNPRMFHVPTLLYTGSNDALADPLDVKVLESTLPNIVGKRNFREYNHVDFVTGMDAAHRCYSDLLQWLPKY